jgi:hypothetical protein
VRHSDRGSGGDPIRSIAQKRFEELDKFHTGRVSFLEVCAAAVLLLYC